MREHGQIVPKLRALENDRLHTFAKSEVAEVKRLEGKSPMPAYRGVLSEGQIDDLVGYLGSLRNSQ